MRAEKEWASTQSTSVHGLCKIVRKNEAWNAVTCFYLANKKKQRYKSACLRSKRWDIVNVRDINVPNS